MDEPAEVDRRSAGVEPARTQTRSSGAETVRAHLLAGLDYQRRLVRFLENHDEPRVAASLPPDMHRAAAVMIATLPGAASGTRASSRGGKSASRCS